MDNSYLNIKIYKLHIVWDKDKGLAFLKLPNNEKPFAKVYTLFWYKAK